MKRAVIATIAALALCACGEEEPVETESPDPVVGPLELPISFRHETSAPATPLRVEIAPGRLRLDGHTLFEMSGGEIPEGERSGDVVPKLAEAIAGSAARNAAVIRAAAPTPYMTTSLVLNTLSEANIQQVAFAVRKGSTTDMGYLKLDRFQVRAEGDEWVEFPQSHQRRWNELEPIWSDMYSACRENHYVDCAFKPESIAEDGAMQITLFTRGNAVKVELHRFGAPDPEPSGGGGGPALLDGLEPAQPAEVEEAPPATTAAFTWRFQASTQEPSVVTATMRPLCGARPCGVVVTAEGQTPTMRILSFLGSAFPNGTDAPQVMFQIPPR